MSRQRNSGLMKSEDFFNTSGAAHNYVRRSQSPIRDRHRPDPIKDLPLIDLYNFEDPEFAFSRYILTSPRSLDACAKVGIQPIDLLPGGGDEQGGVRLSSRDRYYNNKSENLRQELLERVRIERARIIESGATSKWSQHEPVLLGVTGRKLPNDSIYLSDAAIFKNNKSMDTNSSSHRNATFVRKSIPENQFMSRPFVKSATQRQPSTKKRTRSSLGGGEENFGDADNISDGHEDEDLKNKIKENAIYIKKLEQKYHEQIARNEQLLHELQLARVGGETHSHYMLWRQDNKKAVLSGGGGGEQEWQEGTKRSPSPPPEESLRTVVSKKTDEVKQFHNDVSDQLEKSQSLSRTASELQADIRGTFHLQ